MTEPVLPLQTILFQIVFLLIAIALEARVLHRRLNISRKTSIEYATSINLLSAVLGWLGFFILQSLLPQPLKAQLISYIFFDRLLSPLPESLNLVIAATGIAIFFCAFLIKLKGLQLLEALLQSPQEQENRQEQQSLKLLRRSRRQPLPERLDQAMGQTSPNQAAVILLANAYSHSAILLILLLRFFQLNPLI